MVETGIKKEKSLDDVKDEFGKKVLLALKQGRGLILLCSNSAPPLTSKFADPARLPLGLLDAKALAPCLGHEGVPDLATTFLAPTLRFGTRKSEIPLVPATPSGNRASTRWQTFSAKSLSPQEI